MLIVALALLSLFASRAEGLIVVGGTSNDRPQFTEKHDCRSELGSFSYARLSQHMANPPYVPLHPCNPWAVFWAEGEMFGVRGIRVRDDRVRRAVHVVESPETWKPTNFALRMFPKEAQSKFRRERVWCSYNSKIRDELAQVPEVEYVLIRREDGDEALREATEDPGAFWLGGGREKRSFVRRKSGCAKDFGY